MKFKQILAIESIFYTITRKYLPKSKKQKINSNDTFV